MKTKAITNLPARLRKRPLVLMVALLASQGAVAGSLSVGLSNVSVLSGSSHSYNSGAAVCSDNKAEGLTVSADVSVGFTVGGVSGTTFGNCTEHKAKGKTDYYYQTASYTETVAKNSLSVTAADKNTSVGMVGGPTTYSGKLQLPDPAPADDKYGVTVSAAAEETVTVTPYAYERHYDAADTSCAGSYTDTDLVEGKPSITNNKGSNSDSTHFYYVDLQAPTATHNVTNAGNTVQQNDYLNLNIHVQKGSSEQPYTVRGGYDYPSPDGTWGKGLSGSFDKNATTGYDNNEVKTAAAVLVSCSVPVNDSSVSHYVSRAQITATKDLCGNDYAPPPIESTYKGGSGLFDVTENPACSTLSNNLVITAPLPPAINYNDSTSTEESYLVVHCFKSQKAGSGKAKVVSYPGTEHVGTVLTTGAAPEGGPNCGAGNTVQLGSVTFTLNDGDAVNDFAFLKTGNSPQAHVFFGQTDDSLGWADPALDPPGPDSGGPGFYYHTGLPLSEIGIADKISGGSGNTLTIDLSGYDFGCGTNGALPKGNTLYARAHTYFKGTPYVAVGWPSEGEEHTFTATVNVEGSDLTSHGSLYENPVDTSGISACVDGQLVPPPAP